MAKRKYPYPDFPLDDPIARLNVHYFDPCHLLLKEYEKARDAKTRTGARTDEMDRRELCYITMWLASLYAVVEGFKKLKLQDEKVEGLCALHLDSLRLLRNGTFHFQEMHHKQTQFFTQRRVAWAKNLHYALREYFSEYRVSFRVKRLLEDKIKFR
jgi:hypothetical protein